MWKEKFLNSIPTLYRIAVAVAVIYTQIQKIKKPVGNLEIYIVLAVSLFVVLISLAKPGRILVYVEIFIIFGFVYFTKQNIYYLLMGGPVLNWVSIDVNMFDPLLISIFLFLFRAYQSQNFINGVLISGITFLVLETLYGKFNELNVLGENLNQQRKSNSELRSENASLSRDMQIISKMFASEEQLNKIDTENNLFDSFMDGVQYFFMADDVLVYKLDENKMEIYKQKNPESKIKIVHRIEKNAGMETQLTERMIRMPLYLKDALWGAVAVYGKKIEIRNGKQTIPFNFQDIDTEVLGVYNQKVMDQLVLIEQLEKVKYLANYDMLTGLPNRMNFENNIKKFIKDYPLYNFSVAMIDIDNFKSFNDTYGHAVGDEVLKLVSDTLQLGLEDEDFIGRIGGEEIAVLLKDPREKEMEILNTMRKMVNALYSESFKGKIGISIGVARYGEHGEGSDKILKAADDACYVAKKSGKNQVVMYQKGGWV